MISPQVYNLFKYHSIPLAPSIGNILWVYPSLILAAYFMFAVFRGHKPSKLLKASFVLSLPMLFSISVGGLAVLTPSVRSYLEATSYAGFLFFLLSYVAAIISVCFAIADIAIKAFSSPVMMPRK